MLLKSTRDTLFFLYNSGHYYKACESDSPTLKSFISSGVKFLWGPPGSPALLCGVAPASTALTPPHFLLPSASSSIHHAWTQTCRRPYLHCLMHRNVSPVLPTAAVLPCPESFGSLKCRDQIYLKNKLEILELSNSLAGRPLSKSQTCS